MLEGRNKQAPLLLNHSRSDTILDVIEIFDSIQGEGPFSGCPATFIRLAGCTVQCSFCDTDYTTGSETLSIKEIVGQVHHRLVVITGGEPFRQNIGRLARDLAVQNHYVQIETNGAQFLEGFPYDETIIVCCPKGYIDQRLLPKIDFWKFLIGDIGRRIPSSGKLTLDKITDTIRKGNNPVAPYELDRVFIQPIDPGEQEGWDRNMAQAVAFCKETGLRLSLQIHKFLKIR